VTGERPENVAMPEDHEGVEFIFSHTWPT